MYVLLLEATRACLGLGVSPSPLLSVWLRPCGVDGRVGVWSESQGEASGEQQCMKSEFIR